MNHTTRNFLTAATLIGICVATLPAQAAPMTPASIGGRVVGAAGQYLASTGGALVDEVRKQIADGIEPKLQRLPTVVVTPSDEELRDAGIDPKAFHAAKKHR